MNGKLKHYIFLLLSVHSIGRWILNLGFKWKYNNSAGYWEQRYTNNGNSGNGSYGDLAQYKAEFINSFILDNKIKSIIELGCGDGNQLQYLNTPLYIGIDVSTAAIDRCIAIFKNDSSKKFLSYLDMSILKSSFNKTDLALSLDVIYHLVEDDVYSRYMQDLFYLSQKFVIIYAWDTDTPKKLHVKHRQFTQWIAKNAMDWVLIDKVKAPERSGACDFYIYKNKNEIL